MIVKGGNHCNISLKAYSIRILNLPVDISRQNEYLFILFVRNSQ